MVEIMDWMELIWRGIRKLFGYSSGTSESFSSTGEVIAALVVVVLCLAAIAGLVAVLTQ